MKVTSSNIDDVYKSKLMNVKTMTINESIAI